MTDVKDILLRPVDARTARAFVQQHHYSGTAYPKSQVHIGVYLQGSLEGVMQLGPPIQRHRLLGLVEGTPWHGFCELNRMAFSDRLPRNSESRALGIMARLVKRHAPHIQWILSYADATQCGDGTIYRAAGWDLTGIRPNSTLWRMPDGQVVSDIGIRTGNSLRAKIVSLARKEFGQDITQKQAKSVIVWRMLGLERLEGYQIRYQKFLHPTARQRLTVPILDYDEIAKRGASMYRGECGSLVEEAEIPSPPGGASPTLPLFRHIAGGAG